MSRVRLAPSLLAADPTAIADAVAVIEDHVELLHVDVMDGHFVPNISPMGPAMVQALRRRTERTLDVHLMVDRPEDWIGPYREAGADWISVHVEVAPHIHRLLAEIRELGARAGVVLNPGTSFVGLEHVLGEDDFVLVMTVNPGFGGQRFIDSSPDKIEALRGYLDEHGLESVEIEVDGGIDPSTVGRCVRAGARILVAGSSILGADDPVAAAAELRSAAEA